MVFALLLIVFIGSVGGILFILKQYKDNDKLYAQAAEDYTEPAAGEAAPIVVDFEALKAVNEDVVGWIYCEGTVIDYPVVQGEDNDLYLHHSYDKAYSVSGSIFVDSGNRKGFVDSNTIIYGHHMKNGSMFAGLKKYREDDFYEGHKTFRVNTKTGFYTYEIFAVSVVSPNSDTYTLEFADDAEFMDYIARMQERSIHDTGVTVEPGDKIISLSTCVNKNVDRLVVQAKRLEN